MIKFNRASYNRVLKNNIQAPLLLILFIFLVNSVDPDAMLHTVAFHLRLHCLPKCTFSRGVTSIQRVSCEFEISSCFLI